MRGTAEGLMRRRMFPYVTEALKACPLIPLLSLHV